MTTRAVDVLIVGLGPAGGAAAAAAARAGLNVFAIDKKRRVGEPVQCAEFVPLPLGKFTQADGVSIQRIAAMKSFLPSGAVHESAFPGVMIDRAAFDRALTAQAQQWGAAVHSDTRIVALDLARRCATVATQEATGQRRLSEINYRVLIAADGPHSAVADLLKLAPLATVNTRQYTVPLLKPYGDTDVWLTDDFPGGYAWLFPKGAAANLGVGIDKRFADDMKTPLDGLHAQLVERGIVGREIRRRTGGAIPVGGLRVSLVQDTVMFVGDAAGLTHPISGAGIGAAVVSGERAAGAAREFIRNGDANALANFEQDMRDQFEATLTRAVARREQLACAWRTPQAYTDSPMRRGWIAFPEYFAT